MPTMKIDEFELSVNGEAEEVFAHARHATDRRALTRRLRSLDLRSTDPGFHAEVDRFHAERPLCAPEVREFAFRLLAESRGPIVDDVAFSRWPSQFASRDGYVERRSWDEYAELHRQQAELVVPKGFGEVHTPTITTDGHRANASTECMTLLGLDCDGTGDFDSLLDGLSRLELASVIHESSSCAPGAPRWRAMIPLASSYPTPFPEGAQNWGKGPYEIGRTALGAIAGLAGIGFDHALESPSQAIYFGNRRSADSPPRRVFALRGHTLDIQRMIELAPERVEPITGKFGSESRERTDQPSLMELIFDEAGDLGDEVHSGMLAVLCPWNDLHTSPPPLEDDDELTEATVIFPGSTRDNLGYLHCFHAHCGPKSIGDVIEAMPEDVVERAQGRYRKLHGLDRLSDFLRGR